MRRAAGNTLLTILALSAMQLGNFPIPAAPASAAQPVVLASSNPNQNWSAYYSLKEYRSLLGPGSVNWPLRSEGCPATRVTPYKTLPWMAANNTVAGHSNTGDTFNVSGNCADRYLDAGTATNTSPGSSPGAWAYPSALGGWASGASNAGFSPITAAGYTANFNCRNLYGGGAEMIWGAPGPDTNEQAYGPGGLLPQNNWSSAVSDGHGLYSNGTTFFRNTFTLPATYPVLTNIKLYFQADDWMNVYLNGNPLFSTINSSVSQSGVIPLSMLNPPPATNLLAIQVADKAIWTIGDNPSARGSGLCYSMTADVLPPFTIAPQLTNSVLGAIPHLEPGFPPNCSFNAIATTSASQTPPFSMGVTVSGGGAAPWATVTPGSWGPLILGSNLTRPFCVSISSSMPDFATIQQVCFTNTIYPGNWDGATLSATTEDHWGSPPTSTLACLPVFRTRYPAVVGFSGDIHAGGGLCAPQTNTLSGLGSAGFVRGNATLGSYGQYVVSASAPNGIINFGSANSPSGTSLNLGLAGAYARACRPDLLAAAVTYRANGGVNIKYIGVTAPVTDFNLDNKNGIYYFDGPGELDVHGIVGSSVTIINTNQASVLRVSDQIVRSNQPFPPHGVPSLGIISASDIVIPAAVTQVDAYLFANNNIDTCAEASGNVATRTCATPLLTINGFLMARNIYFHRLGQVGIQGVVTAEQVTLSPQIYLNPPKFFDFTIDANFADGQGEKQPLF